MINTYRYFNKSFYPYALEADYTSSGTWPDNGVDVDDASFIEFTGLPPDGKVLITGSDGCPTWGDAPPITHGEEVAAAEQRRQLLLLKADEITADWRIELMLGDISNQDKEKLSAWMDYKKKVKAVDTSTAPDIVWPTQPSAQAS